MPEALQQVLGERKRERGVGGRVEIVARIVAGDRGVVQTQADRGAGQEALLDAEVAHVVCRWIRELVPVRKALLCGVVGAPSSRRR